MISPFINNMEQIKIGEYQTKTQPFKLWNEVNGYALGISKEDLLAPKTIQITGCERIILKDKSLDFQFELTKGKIEDYDEIIINGIKFRRVKE